jgi:type IV secretion system protein TrbL
MACSLTDPGGCLADLAGSAAGSIANSAFSDIAKDFGNAADSAVNWLWGQIGGATAISLTGSAMTRDLAIVTTLAAVVATGLFAIQIIASVLRHDGRGLARAVKGLLVAFLGSVGAIATTSLLLASVDAVSAGFVQAATGDSTQQMGTRILSATAITAAGNPAVVLVLALIVLGAVIVVWGAMMVRKLLIIVAAVFAPLAFAGATSDISTSWVRKWIETMVALIVSKLILVIVFVIGLGVLTDGLGEATGPSANASATQSVTQTIIGALILLMGGFAPFLAIKLVHFGGEHFAQLHGHAQASLAGAHSVAAAPQKAQRLAAGFGTIGAGSAGGSRASGPGGSGASSTSWGNPTSSIKGSASGLTGSGSGAASSSVGAVAGSGMAAAAGGAGVAVGVAGAAKDVLDGQIAHVSDASSGVQGGSPATPATPADGAPTSGRPTSPRSSLAASSSPVPPVPSGSTRSEGVETPPPVTPPPPKVP